jgi:hypothetical protein
MEGADACKAGYVLFCKFSRVVVIAAYFGSLVEVKSMGRSY